MKITKLLKLHNNPKFAFYAGQVTLNNISVAVYDLDDSNYLLIKEDDNDNALGHATITKECYENLDSDPYNSLIEFLAAKNLCSSY